ncbi:hypothetical protein EHI45_00950 [Rhizobium leguminosarum]|uniref:hypothetical protein n=1 Tax=Rhizobium leguminosarum TaxID=384 RepID=UPI000FEC5CCD|nr:hypothetical protein [Rhizobium leguminosarum]RWX19240.1 hypothetical protein EHI45_00950 [Rhizobium leguminosarum]
MLDLSNKRILISASLPPHIHDITTEAKLDNAIISLCSSLVSKGATIVYGGNLDEKGFTEKIAKRLAHVAPNGGQPNFVHIIDEPSFVLAGFSRLRDVLVKRNPETIWTYACVGGEWGRVFSSGDRIELNPEFSPSIRYREKTFPADGSVRRPADAFSFARQIKIDTSDACIAIGGKTGMLEHPRDQYFGDLPGVAEEAILMLRAGKPTIPLGRYGGCGSAIADALDLVTIKSDNEPRRQPGFKTAMEALKLLGDQVPFTVRDDVVLAAKSHVDPKLVEVISSIIVRWGEPKPRTGNDTPSRHFGG